MPTTRDTFRDELLATLAAGRELSPAEDQDLVEVLLHRLERPAPAPIRTPSYALVVSGLMWGIALTWLIAIPVEALARDQSGPEPLAYFLFCLLVAAVLTVPTRTLLYLARHNWHLPRVDVRILPPDPRRG